MDWTDIVLLSFAALMLLFFTMLFVPVRLALSYDKAVTLRVKLLCFSFRLFPRKKKWKMKEHLPEYRKKKKRGKKKRQPPKHSPKREAPQEGKLEKIKRQYSEMTALLNTVIFPIAERLGKHLTVKISRLELCDASADAAKTALLYAAAVNGAYALLATIDEYANLKRSKNEDVRITCRYDLDQTSVCCDLELGISLYGGLYTLLPVLLNYLQEQSNGDL